MQHSRSEDVYIVSWYSHFPGIILLAAVSVNALRESAIMTHFAGKEQEQGRTSQGYMHKRTCSMRFYIYFDSVRRKADHVYDS